VCFLSPYDKSSRDRIRDRSIAHIRGQNGVELVAREKRENYVSAWGLLNAWWEVGKWESG
jgi:hypothetical protein